MTQPGAYVIPKLSDVSTSTEQMQNCFRTFLQNVHRSFSIKPNPKNCDTMARRFTFI